ncbi:patatin-like phospholipase family protein [Kaarinaea lacus]
MDIQSMISNPELTEKLAQIRSQIQKPGHHISDIVDADNNQYIDLVLEGGGMLGIALVGYSWALEEMGVRFFGIGGTSAGSINALLLAALDEPAKPKSPRLLNELANKNFYDFVDGGDDVRDLIELALGSEKKFKGLRMFYKAMKVKRQLCTKYGLNKGDAFLSWLHGLLSGAGIDTLEDLETRLSIVPKGLRRRGDSNPIPDTECPRGKLVIVAADVTTETRVEFPAMAKLYWEDPSEVSPAMFARASMSIPFFFEPFRVGNIPANNLAKKNWGELAGIRASDDPSNRIPMTVMFVDGGIMSNFPIGAFHDVNKVPSMPTFGVKLEYDQRCKSPDKFPTFGRGNLKDLGPLAGSIFNSSRHTLDFEFIKRHPDYRHLVQFIPCTYKEGDKVLGYNWLDFNMPEEHKSGLFIQGANKAIEFIEGFSSEYQGFSSKWEYYKDLRARLIEKSGTSASSRSQASAFEVDPVT